MPNELTTSEVAAILNITPRRVRALIKAGRLPAEKHGRDWAITPEDLELVKVRKPGRPARSPEEILEGLPVIRDYGTVALMIKRRQPPRPDERS